MVAAIAVLVATVLAGKLLLARYQEAGEIRAGYQEPGEIGPRPASGNASPPIRVIDDRPTSLKLAVTLPDGGIVTDTIDFLPNQTYQPTPAELQSESSGARQVFGARFRVEGGRLLMNYVVRTQTLPMELRERLGGKSDGAASIDLVSSAWAQPAMGPWTGIQTGMSIGDYTSNMVKGLKPFSKLASNAEKVGGALALAEQFEQWMQAFDQLENCARNPTHQVTQEAYQKDPGYQQRTVDAISQARSEVTQATGLSYVNQEANVGMQLAHAPGILTQLTKAVSGWNDSALLDIGNGLLADASKLVDCDLAPPPPPAGDGTITYHLHREGFFGIDVDDQVVKVSLSLSPAISIPVPGANAVDVRGLGEFKGKIVSQQSNECSGTADVRGGSSFGHMHMSGGAVSGKCVGARFEDAARNAAFTCDFDGVDVVNGGTYEVQAAGEFAAWTSCKLELKPQQK